ncbi:regulator of volume decrease after cellular swelling-domain-containing protein [Echria macrotheca]|uniref:Regulator of volume decrease after cellular swelling-domain-containing protein n=1 Tax=Echria macrotheca TaxID=438768 RepID=A0AAJ0BLE6_9PEZI|nr:regulator of volume decrease after cellular swelling-domain-containing protein [Echria macrotheca]
MIPSTIRSSPSLADYTPLSEYQEQTPASFVSAKPILYYHGKAKAWIPSAQRGSLPIFPADLSSRPSAPENSTLDDQAEETVEQAVDLFVNSETLTLYSPAAEIGVSIPYPLVSIHAVKTLGSGEQTYPSVYLQLNLSDGGPGDDEFDTVELTLIPAAESTSQEPTAGASPAKSEAAKLFEAISECSDLNPDPAGEDDEEDEDDRIRFEGDLEAVEGYSAVYTGASDGGLPPPLPGSSGWITAENVHEFFDADGNWIGGDEEEEGASGELGEGAGTVRRREEEEGVNGHEGREEGDSKRPRVE